MTAVNPTAELIPSATFPPTWTRESCARLAALGIEPDEVESIESRLAHFRRIRDEVAVERYQARLRDLRQTVSALRNELSPLIAERWSILRLDKSVRVRYAFRLQTLNDEIRRIGELYQAADHELTGIEADYPRRVARLKGA